MRLSTYQWLLGTHVHIGAREDRGDGVRRDHRAAALEPVVVVELELHGGGGARVDRQADTPEMSVRRRAGPARQPAGTNSTTRRVAPAPTAELALEIVKKSMRALKSEPIR
jgi:hypothetical protein